MKKVEHVSGGPPAADWIWIDSVGPLEDYCRELRAAGEFGFDTEFIGERTFFPELCLIQLCGAGKVALVDPTAVRDLSPVGVLLADHEIIKYCHAGEQDIAIMHQCGFTPRSVFDTQLMAGLLGYVYPISYARLVEQICSVELDKSHTYSAWDRRPLARAQLAYAADDVRYLPAVYNTLRERIEKRDRTAWMKELCDEELREAVEPPNPGDLWMKIKAPRSMTRRQLGVLRELTAWRHQLAYEHDTPVRAFLTDAAIRDIAKLMPGNMAQLSRIEGISSQELHSYGPFILDLIRTMQVCPMDQLPEALQEAKEAPELGQYVERVWAAAQMICLGQNVATGLVTSQASMAQWAAKKMAGERPTDHPIMRGWRRECLGGPLEELMDGRSRFEIRVRNRDITLTIQPGN